MLLNRHRALREDKVTAKESIIPREPVKEIPVEDVPAREPQTPPQKPRSNRKKSKK